ncbi:MAG: cytochrome c biogenesis protein CcdA [Actinomycetota bacterium]
MGAFALALVAGVISFSSPCCLPLMPGYVSYVSGVAGVSATATAVRHRTLGAAALFVLGFALVFTAMGASASALGSQILQHRIGLTQIAGVVVLAFGLTMLGVVRAPFLYRERRLALHRIQPGPAGALPLGAAFAVGWTPCIGPVLAAILAVAASTSTPARGAALLFTYSLGLGIPFLLLAAGVARGGRFLEWLRRRARAIEIVGGSLLVAMGVLMVTGAWVSLFTPILRLFSETGWPPL